MSDASASAVPQHRFAIFFASFLTLIASGMGFAIRARILEDWAAQFGFTMTELGTISGAGLVGFGVIIILASTITDRLGYRTIMLAAFVCHIISALVTITASPVYLYFGQEATYWALYVAMFIFAVGNGLCEAAINPLVATLYPRQKTHYLNILHAGWPGGMILGALMAIPVTGEAPLLVKLPWEIPMCFYLIPTLIYGVITIKERFPMSEARAAGVPFGRQILQFLSPLLIILLVLQACVGYVELGSDSWITNITNEIVHGYGLWLFIWASAIMFVLRFCAGPIVSKINPLGLLFCSACIGATGLFFIGKSADFSTNVAFYSIWIAVTVYGIGKSFYWPTMLGIVGEQFPRGGALTMGTVGGIGMLSAGLLGSPGIGFNQDYFATQKLQELSPAAYKRYAAEDANQFLGFQVRGLNGRKVEVVRDPDGPGTQLAKEVARLKEKEVVNDDLAQLNAWWQSTAKEHAAQDREVVNSATIYGGSTALMLTALVPTFMAVSYLLLVLYFHFVRGGYRQVHLEADESAPPPREGEGEKSPDDVGAPVV